MQQNDSLADGQASPQRTLRCCSTAAARGWTSSGSNPSRSSGTPGPSSPGRPAVHSVRNAAVHIYMYTAVQSRAVGAQHWVAYVLEGGVGVRVSGEHAAI